MLMLFKASMFRAGYSSSCHHAPAWFLWGKLGQILPTFLIFSHLNISAKVQLLPPPPHFYLSGRGREGTGTTGKRKRGVLISGWRYIWSNTWLINRLMLTFTTVFDATHCSSAFKAKSGQIDLKLLGKLDFFFFQYFGCSVSVVSVSSHFLCRPSVSGLRQDSCYVSTLSVLARASAASAPGTCTAEPQDQVRKQIFLH